MVKPCLLIRVWLCYGCVLFYLAHFGGACQRHLFIMAGSLISLILSIQSTPLFPNLSPTVVRHVGAFLFATPIRVFLHHNRGKLILGRGMVFDLHYFALGVVILTALAFWCFANEFLPAPLIDYYTQPRKLRPLKKAQKRVFKIGEIT